MRPDFYDLVLPWDIRITWSGTFLHYSTGDPYPGHSYGSHGCVHLSYADAEWYYDLSKQGDPVTIKYKMIATSIEGKEAKAKDTKVKETKVKAEEKKDAKH